MKKVPIDRVKAIKLNEDIDPAKLEACRAYARMMNTCDWSHIVGWLNDDLKYNSSWVKEEMIGKDNYLNYIKGKIETLKRSTRQVWAEIAYTDAFGAGPCVVLAQGTPENLIATMLMTMREGKISEMCMSIIPAPQECRRTGEFPK